jgi:hypothetical protein
MREAIVIQPQSCKPFGLTLNEVVRSTAMYVANPQRRTAVLRGSGRGSLRPPSFCRITCCVTRLWHDTCYRNNRAGRRVATAYIDPARQKCQPPR